MYNLEILSYYRTTSSSVTTPITTGTETTVPQNGTEITNTTTGFSRIIPIDESSRNYGNLTSLILISTLILLFVFSVYILFNLASGKPSFSFKFKKTYSSSPIVEFKKILEENVEELRMNYQKGSNPILELYRKVCDFLIKEGVEDAPHLTAREFEENVYKILNFKPRSFRELTLLFEEARYSNHEISQDKVDLAKELVEDIIKELEEKL